MWLLTALFNSKLRRPNVWELLIVNEYSSDPPQQKSVGVISHYCVPERSEVRWNLTAAHCLTSEIANKMKLTDRVNRYQLWKLTWTVHHPRRIHLGPIQNPFFNPSGLGCSQHYDTLAGSVYATIQAIFNPFIRLVSSGAWDLLQCSIPVYKYNFKHHLSSRNTFWKVTT